MSSVYVASGIKNYELVIDVQRRLRGLGVSVVYDWAAMEAEDRRVNRKRSPSERVQLSVEEIDAVRTADILLLIQPCGRGAHVEMGAALGLGKPVVVVNPDPELDVLFYQHPLVVKTTELEQRILCVCIALGIQPKANQYA